VVDGVDRAGTAAEHLGDYCRRVEEHLARVNAGNLVRVFGPAFELVRGWFEADVPLSVVFRGIEQKAARHQAGQSKRPLRLEFCAADVNGLFADWRRAVGVQVDRRGRAGELAATGQEPIAEPGARRSTIARQLDRAIEKLALTTGRLDASADVQAETARLLDALSRLRDESRGARGDAKRAALERARAIDRDLGRLARLSGGAVIASVEAEAVKELMPFRSRLKADDWQRSVDANVDRLLRARSGVPTLDLEDGE
jgi:hypothetical protein